MPCTAKQPNDYLTSVAGLHDQPEVPRACGVWRRKEGVADDKDSHKLCNPRLLRIRQRWSYGVAMSSRAACVAKLDLFEILRERTCSLVTS